MSTVTHPTASATFDPFSFDAIRSYAGYRTPLHHDDPTAQQLVGQESLDASREAQLADIEQELAEYAAFDALLNVRTKFGAETMERAIDLVNERVDTDRSKLIVAGVNARIDQLTAALRPV